MDDIIEKIPQDVELYIQSIVQKNNLDYTAFKDHNIEDA